MVPSGCLAHGPPVAVPRACWLWPGVASPVGWTPSPPSRPHQSAQVTLGVSACSPDPSGLPENGGGAAAHLPPSRTLSPRCPLRLADGLLLQEPEAGRPRKPGQLCEEDPTAPPVQGERLVAAPALLPGGMLGHIPGHVCCCLRHLHPLPARGLEVCCLHRILAPGRAPRPPAFRVGGVGVCTEQAPAQQACPWLCPCPGQATCAPTGRCPYAAHARAWRAMSAGLRWQEAQEREGLLARPPQPAPPAH